MRLASRESQIIGIYFLMLLGTVRNDCNSNTERHSAHITKTDFQTILTFVSVEIQNVTRGQNETYS